MAAAIKIKNLEQFKFDLSKFKDRTDAEMVLILKKVALQLLTLIVEKTPIDTGRARGNWQVAVDTGAGTATVDGADLSGSKTIAAGFAELAGVKPTSTIVIFNNVEYIVALEEGHSKQAPVGMVAISIAEVQAQFP